MAILDEILQCVEDDTEKIWIRLLEGGSVEPYYSEPCSLDEVSEYYGFAEREAFQTNVSMAEMALASLREDRYDKQSKIDAPLRIAFDPWGRSSLFRQ